MSLLRPHLGLGGVRVSVEADPDRDRTCVVLELRGPDPGDGRALALRADDAAVLAIDLVSAAARARAENGRRNVT